MLGNISIKIVYKLLKENTIEHIKIGKIYRIPKINVIKYLNISD